LSQFLLLAAVLLGLGLLVRRARPAGALADHLNWWIVNLAFPATVLELVPGLHFSGQLWFLVIPQWGLAAGTALLFHALGTRLGWTRTRIGTFTLLTAFSNTGMLGYPLLEALRGREGIALAVLADQLGCFIGLAVGGAMLVAVYSGNQPDARLIARRIVTFPAFIALLVALAVSAAGGWPAPVPPLLHRLSQTLAPLALFSMGLRLSVHLRRGQRAAAAFALAWKLALMPLLAWLLGHAARVQGLPLTVGVLETAMAPTFTAAILARQHELDHELTDTLMSLGMLLSFLTVPAWSLLLP